MRLCADHLVVAPDVPSPEALDKFAELPLALCVPQFLRRQLDVTCSNVPQLIDGAKLLGGPDTNSRLKAGN